MGRYFCFCLNLLIPADSPNPSRRRSLCQLRCMLGVCSAYALNAVPDMLSEHPWFQTRLRLSWLIRFIIASFGSGRWRKGGSSFHVGSFQASIQFKHVFFFALCCFLGSCSTQSVLLSVSGTVDLLLVDSLVKWALKESQ